MLYRELTIMESTMGSAIDSISGSTGFSFIKVSFIRDCLQCFFFSAYSKDQKRQNECCRFCHREGQPDSCYLQKFFQAPHEWNEQQKLPQQLDQHTWNDLFCGLEIGGDHGRPSAE